MDDKSIKVLLIEDNPGDARLVREALADARNTSFELECVDRLSTGLKRLAEGEIDVVLLDLSLPDSSGLDTFAKVHTHASAASIVVLTGLDDETLAVETVQRGAQDYLVKGHIDGNLLVRSLRYAIERKRAEQIKVSLREKEVLLQEIHHRVKNNLQVISSLLSLQSGYIEDKQAIEMIEESQNRIKSIALIHEQLYQSKDLARIDLTKYIRHLVADLFRSYGVNSETITLKINIDNILLDMDTAIPCGLIINELASNSLKHAFPAGKGGEIRIDLHSDKDNQFTLIISDNGVGFPGGLDFRDTKSLGLQLVNTLVDQLGGTIELHSNGGTEFKLAFSSTRSH